MSLERGASARLLLASLPDDARQYHLASLAHRDPRAAARLTERVITARRDGWAVSEEEIDTGVWAASAAVRDSTGIVAALTVQSPLVRAPAAMQETEGRGVVTTDVRTMGLALLAGGALVASSGAHSPLACPLRENQMSVALGELDALLQQRLRLIVPPGAVQDLGCDPPCLESQSDGVCLIHVSQSSSRQLLRLVELAAMRPEECLE